MPIPVPDVDRDDMARAARQRHYGEASSRRQCRAEAPVRIDAELSTGVRDFTPPRDTRVQPLHNNMGVSSDQAAEL